MDNTQQAAQPQADPNVQGVTPETFEAFLEAQPAEVKDLYGRHTEALMNTVKATRSERDNLTKQIKDLAKTQAEGSEARKSLDEMSAKLEQTERRADFMEEAMKPEVQCKNPRAAFLLAQAEGHFDKAGRPNWAAIRAEAPELFGAASANANAGAGTQKPPAASASMNDYIRTAAGRK